MRFLILFSLLLLAATGKAQQTDPGSEGRLKGLSLEELGNIEVVTTSKSPVKLSQTPAAVYVITQEDIRRAGVTSIPEALRLAPGVDVAQIDGVKWAVGIRGFESRLSRDVLVLIDGRSVYSPLFHGVYWEVQDTLLEDIDRIEVIRGPGGTIWGANAVNGVINIITRNAKDTKGTLVSATGGNLNQGLLDIRQGGGSDNFAYRVYAKGVDQAPEFHADNHQFDDWRHAQAGFRTDWNATDRDKVTVQGDIYDGAAGERANVTILSPPALANVEENARLSGGNVLTRWQRTLKDGSDIQLLAYYDRVNRLQANQAEYRNTFDVDFVHHLLLGKRNDFLWGLEARLSPASLPEIVPSYVFTPNQRIDQVYTAYAQDTFALVENKLSLTAGTKLLHSSFTGWDAEPSVRVLWTPTSRSTLWGAVTRAVRTPSDIEDTLVNTALLSTNPLEFTRIIGDGKFTSETLVGYEIGYRSLIAKSVSLDIATFYNQYDHLLSLEPGVPFVEDDQGTPAMIYPFINGNGVKGSTSGFELALDWKARPWWRLVTSYSFLNTDLRAAPFSEDTTTVFQDDGESPHNQGQIQSYLDLSKTLDLNLTFRYVGALPYYRVSSYETGDARIAWRPIKHWEFALTGQNLLQPHHVEYGGDPGPLVGIRRNVFGSVIFRK